MDNGAGSYRRFLDGDESAFDEIMKELFHSLVFFVDRYVKDVHTAEDIAIDVFSDLIVHKNRYNFKVSLKTYLFMCGRSRAIDHLRRRKIIQMVGISEIPEIEDDGRTLEEIVLSQEIKRVVNSAISKLPFDMAQVVHLVYFENMTYDEAAKVMKMNRKKIDNLLYRAKKELRDIIGEEGRLLL